jgi:hypothetical protein
VVPVMSVKFIPKYDVKNDGGAKMIVMTVKMKMALVKGDDRLHDPTLQGSQVEARLDYEPPSAPMVPKGYKTPSCFPT